MSLNTDTLQKLRSFHVPGFIQALVEQRESKQYGSLSFEERLTFLIEAEFSRRVAQKITRKIKDADLLQTQATLESIDFEIPRGLSKNQFLELSQGNWITNAHHLVITGPTGSGKSFIASALAVHLCRKNFSVKYMRANEWLGEILIQREKNNFKKFKKTLCRYDILIIDEWLREPLSQAHAREFLDLLDDRYRQGSVIVISQIPVSDWHPIISDPTIADAILDRLVHDSIRIDLKGESMRKLTSTLSSKASLRSDGI